MAPPVQLGGQVDRRAVQARHDWNRQLGPPCHPTLIIRDFHKVDLSSRAPPRDHAIELNPPAHPPPPPRRLPDPPDGNAMIVLAVRAARNSRIDPDHSDSVT